MTLACFLSLAVLDGEVHLVLIPVLLEDPVQGLVLLWWLSCHSTTGVSDLDPQHGDGQLVPLVDLSQGLLAGSSGFWRMKNPSLFLRLGLR